MGAVLLAIGVPFLAVQGQDAAGDWRVGAVQQLADAGLETGFPDGSFLAADPLTGYQAAVLIDRLLDQVAARTGCAAPAPAAAAFADVPGEHWAADAVAQVAALGVGEAFPEGSFGGDATLSGYQTALLVARALASADDQVACSEQAGAQAVADLRAEVGELRAAIADGSLQGPVGPAGEPGPAGPEGPAGPAGPAGADGAIGADGAAGPAGEPGPPGNEGPVGPAGADGAIGPVGPAGPAGADGQIGADGVACWDLDGDGLPGLVEDVNLDGVFDALDCIGPVGPVGPLGPQGPEGAVGPPGSTGPQGLQGPQGPVGPQGEVGLQGADGPAGAVGATGPVGPAGPIGETGPAGPEGAAGPQGLPGAKGDTGEPGAQGSTGPVGPAGPAGPAGPVGPKGDTGECQCDVGVLDEGLRISLP